MLRHLLSTHPTLQEISICFRVSGHSFLPNDSDFGDVECVTKRHETIYSVDGYIACVEKARAQKPFIVQRMKRDDFFRSNELEDGITNR
jgi:hypothetical protein